MTFGMVRPAGLLFAAGLLAAASFAQQQNPVSLQAFPQTVSLASGERRQITVVATAASVPVRKLVLTARAEPGAAVTIGKPPDLPADIRGDVSWLVWIAKSDDGRPSAKVLFQARYEYENSEKKPVPGLSQLIVELTAKQRLKTEEVVAGTIRTSADKLEETRPHQMYLIVNNLIDVPLYVSGLRASLPEFARIALQGTGKPPTAQMPNAGGWIQLFSAPSKPIVIAPRQQSVFQLVLEIPENAAVLAGKYQLLFQVDLKYTKDGYSAEGSLVVPHEFEAGVLGQQEFVGVTEVPFLLLPGFLFVTAASLLLGKVWPKWNISLDPKKPEFYLLGVLFSIGAVLVYPLLSPWLYHVIWKTKIGPRNYLLGYSLKDIINVWVLALGSALAPWMAVGGVWNIVSKIRAKILSDQTPSALDEPLDLLARLVRAGKSWGLPTVTVGGARLWEIPLPSPDPAKKWVVGRTEVKFVDPNDPRHAEFTNLLTDASTTVRMEHLLRELRNKNAVELLWNPQRPPELVAKGDAPRAGGQDPFIHELV
jgi:hypothetical protein